MIECNHYWVGCGSTKGKAICAKCKQIKVAAYLTKQKKDKGFVSDGYHTFNELYNHRNLLFINLCLTRTNTCWIKDEEDYPGYFCLYMKTNYGQISYHMENKYRHLVEGKVTGKQQRWDKHTSKTVIETLFSLAGGE